MLYVGAAKTDITPPLPFDAQPNWRGEPSLGVHSPLYARACVLRSDDTKVVIVAADVLGLSPPYAEEIRQAIAAAIACDPTNVLLNSSHSHRAAALGWPYKMGSAFDATSTVDVAYAHYLPHKYVGAAIEADAQLAQATVSAGVGRVSGLAVNRRERTEDGGTILGWNRDGFIDEEVPTLRIDTLEGEPIATILSFGCHPIVLGCRCPDSAYDPSGSHFFDVSSDYPGVVCESIEESRGGICLFLQGAAGNVDPLECFFDEPGPERRMGERLAFEALHAIADPAPEQTQINRLEHEYWSVSGFNLYRRERVVKSDHILAVASKTVEWPFLPPPALSDLESELNTVQRDLDAEAKAGNRSLLLRNNLLYAKNWLDLTIPRIRDDSAPRSAPAEIWALRIGEYAIAAAPGEIFSETGYAVRSGSPAAVTLFAGYANGVLGYVPIRDEYAYGGYEPALAQRTYGNPAPFAPEAAELVEQVGNELLTTLFDASLTKNSSR